MDDQTSEPVPILLHAWRHETTGKLHIRGDCRAVQFQADAMTPLLIRVDNLRELERTGFGAPEACRWCFPP